jgi:hypothetical protein
MAAIDFINQLKVLGYTTQEPSYDKVYFEYTVEVGSNKGKKVFMGFENLNDFPMNAPHGPHFKSIDEGWINPSGASPGVHPSNFGTGWVHWSRPFNEWNRTSRSVKEYLAHLRNVFMTV